MGGKKRVKKALLKEEGGKQFVRARIAKEIKLRRKEGRKSLASAGCFEASN